MSVPSIAHSRSPACSSPRRPLTNTDTHTDTSKPAYRLTRWFSIATHGLLRAERRLLRGTRGPYRAAGHRQDGESGDRDTDPTGHHRAGVWRWLLSLPPACMVSQILFSLPLSSLFTRSRNPLPRRKPIRTPLGALPPGHRGIRGSQ